MRPTVVGALLRAALLAGVPLSPSVAQVLSGRVVEEGTRAPVAEAEVSVLDPAGGDVVRVISDTAGIFRLVLPSPGDYVLRVRRIGFVPWRSEPLELDRRESMAVEIRLGRTAVALEPIVVVARAPASGRLSGYRERQRSSATGSFITREDMERRPAAEVTELLRNLSGVTIVRVPRVAGVSPEPGLPAVATTALYTNVIAVRSPSGPCLASVWLDGVFIEQSASFPVDDLLTSDDLEGIEVYRSTGAAPVQYHRPGTCGAVLLWSRELGTEGNRFAWKRLAAGLGLFGAAAFLISR